MKYHDLLKILKDHQDDYEFEYKSKRGAVLIFENEVIAGYDGSEIHFKDLDSALSSPFVDGKRLVEVADDLLLI